MAVVGVSQNLLRFRHGRIEQVMKVTDETTYEHLQGIAEAFAGDADLVKVLVVLQIAAGGLVQFVQKAGKQWSGVLAKMLRRPLLRRILQRFQGARHELLEVGRLFFDSFLKLALGLLPLAER